MKGVKKHIKERKSTPKKREKIYTENTSASVLIRFPVFMNFHCAVFGGNHVMRVYFNVCGFDPSYHVTLFQ